MSVKQWASILAAAVAVAAIIGIAYVTSWRSGTEDSDRTSKSQADIEPQARSPKTQVAPGVREAATPDLPCTARATPALASGSDQRIKDLLQSNWASQADPPRKAMTRLAAIEAARAMSTDAPAPGAGTSGDAFPAAAAQVPYQTADKWAGGTAQENSLIAPQRCVWVVTVNAPFSPRSAPDPSVRNSFDNYTAMFDARSGQYLGVSAGADAANLLSGERLNSN